VRTSPKRDQRGITLVTTLLLLLLLTGMSLTMVMAVSSESLINGYYGSYRAAFYAADSGVSIARQALKTTLNNAVPANFAPAAAPMPGGENTTAGNSLGTTYGPFTAINTAGSWNEKFSVQGVQVGAPTCSVSGGLTVGGVAPTCASPTQNAANPIQSYTYVFPYQFSVVGESRGTEVATVVDKGSITVVANTGLAPVNQAFSAYGMFIDQYALCGGGDLVPGTITGPVFTNGSWNFSNSGAYTFTDAVGQANAQAGFDNGGCQASATAPANGINPTFKNGFYVGQTPVALPTDSFNQEQAVLDGIGNTTTSPSNANLNAALKNASGTAYPVGGAASGVYLPYSINASTGVKTFTGGGIFVQGDAKVTLTPSGASAQVYTIVQGGVTTTVTIDPVANSTVMTTGSSTQTIIGVPQQIGANGVSDGPATMLYVNGNITGLSGPGQGQAAIQNGSAVTVTAASNVTVTGDILYKAEPVTLAASGSTPIDTLIPANNTGQVLGIFTATGNVNLANTQSNGNLEIDASVATLSQGGSGGIVNTGSAINTLTIVGGRIQNTIQNINSTTRNVLFDRRFANGAFAPPWFPSTAVVPLGGGNPSVTTTVKAVQWLNQTNYQ
jgi:Tfp pilus assembly protein PilX